MLDRAGKSTQTAADGVAWRHGAAEQRDVYQLAKIWWHGHSPLWPTWVS